VVNDLGGAPAGGGSSSEPVDLVIKEIESAGGNAIADHHSVTDGPKIVQSAIDRFDRIDVIVNNAGIIRYKPLEHHIVDDFRCILEINTLGALSLTLAAWSQFSEEKIWQSGVFHI
jgi:NADP-dependent 3-hydroxy acid dehydrogenase YdfG